MSSTETTRRFNVTIATWNSKVYEVQGTSRDDARMQVWTAHKASAPKGVKYHDVRAALFPNVPSVISATEELYGALSKAFKIFNAKLFDGELPDVVFTVDRSAKSALGFFWHKIWENAKNGDRIDEICINASYLKERTLTDILSTLIHEMCHLWQYAHGKPSRNGYHNKQWAEKMKEIGLYPSDTGAVGGKETGQRMTHYIMEKGPFAALAAPMIADGFTLKYTAGNPLLAGKKKPGEDGDDNESDADESEKTKSPKKKVKYTCSGCDMKVWGKPDLRVICGECEQELDSDY